MMHPGWVCLWAALASTASAGGAALLYVLAHESLSVAADPLPFLVLALGVLGWLLQAPPAGQATAQRRRKAWQANVASELEAAARSLVGMGSLMCTQTEQREVQRALALLQTLFTAALEEGTRSDAKTDRSGDVEALESGRISEPSASALACRFEALAQQLCRTNPASFKPGPISRSVDAVASALASIPDDETSSMAGNESNLARRLGAAMMLVVFPVYCAASAHSLLGAACAAFVAGLGIMCARHRSPNAAQDANFDFTQRHRLFNLRIMELQSLLQKSKVATGAMVPAACHDDSPAKSRRNKVALNMQEVSQPSVDEMKKRSAIALKGLAESFKMQGSIHLNDADDDLPVQPFTLVGTGLQGRGQHSITRAVPITIGKSVAEASRLRADQDSIAGMPARPFDICDLNEAVRMRRSGLGQEVTADISSAVLSSQPKQTETSSSSSSPSPSSEASEAAIAAIAQVGTLEESPLLKKIDSISKPVLHSDPQCVSTLDILATATSKPAEAESMHPSHLRMPETPGQTPIKRELNSGMKQLPDISLDSFSLSPGGAAHNLSSMFTSISCAAEGVKLQDDARVADVPPLTPAFRPAGVLATTGKLDMATNKRYRQRAIC